MRLAGIVVEVVDLPRAAPLADDVSLIVSNVGPSNRPLRRGSFVPPPLIKSALRDQPGVYISLHLGVGGIRFLALEQLRDHLHLHFLRQIRQKILGRFWVVRRVGISQQRQSLPPARGIGRRFLPLRRLLRFGIGAVLLLPLPILVLPVLFLPTPLLLVKSLESALDRRRRVFPGRQGQQQAAQSGKPPSRELPPSGHWAVLQAHSRLAVL